MATAAGHLATLVDSAPLPTSRALGVPVYELFGGPVRDSVRLYWSHCATYRVNRAKEMQVAPVRTQPK